MDELHEATGVHVKQQLLVVTATYLLDELRAAVDARSAMAKTPLHESCWGGHVECAT